MEDSLNKLFSNTIHHLIVPDNDIGVVMMMVEVVNIYYHNDRHQVADMTVGFVAVGPYIDHADMTSGHFAVGHHYIDYPILVDHH